MATPTTAFRVVIPGAPDVYDLIPDSALSPDDRSRRRQQRAIRISQSPTPEIVRDTTTILTRIDDVQDALVTLSLITRFAVPYVTALAPFAKAVAVAADITNIAGILQNLGLVGGTGKSTLFRHLATQPGTYATRLRTTLRTSRVNPTIGELLQVLQTTDAIFGVGMQLGAVMGIPGDLLALAIRGGALQIPVDALIGLATLAPAFFGASPWAALIGLAAGFGLSQIPQLTGQTLTIPFPGILPTNPDTAATVQGNPASLDMLTALETADQVLTDTSYLDTLGQELTPTEHALLELARYQALAVLSIPAIAAAGGILQPESHPPVSPRAPATRHPFRWLHENPSHPDAIMVASLLGEAWTTLALSMEPPDSLQSHVWSEHTLAVAKAVELSTPIPSPGPTRPAGPSDST